MQAGHGKLNLRDVGKAFRVYPSLGELLELVMDLDEDADGDESVHIRGENALRLHVAQLASDVLEERERDADSGEAAELQAHAGSLQHSQASPDIVQTAKNFLRIQQEVVSCLWDDRGQRYEHCPKKNATRLKETALERQGRDRGDSRHGERFLQTWSCDLSGCRTTLTEIEMAEILLSSPLHKKPGPDGIPGLFYKRNAKVFVPVFLEAMRELQEDLLALQCI